MGRRCHCGTVEDHRRVIPPIPSAGKEERHEKAAYRGHSTRRSGLARRRDLRVLLRFLPRKPASFSVDVRAAGRGAGRSGHILAAWPAAPGVLPDYGRTGGGAGCWNVETQELGLDRDAGPRRTLPRRGPDVTLAHLFTARRPRHERRATWGCAFRQGGVVLLGWGAVGGVSDGER